MAKHGAVTKRRMGPWHIVSIVSAIVLVLSLVALGVIAFSYWQGQRQYDEVRETAAVPKIDPDKPQSLADMKVDWEALRAVNPDIVAWIIMPDTPIDYPVVKTSDNEYYLDHAFDGSENWLASYGTIFMDCTNNAECKDACTFLYGHHMNDGSMFAFLDKLTNQATFDDNRYIYLLTPDGNYRLKTFSSVVTTGSDMIVETNFANDAARMSYIQDKIERSVVDAGDDSQKALSSPRIFAMSTCDYSRDDGRAILFSYVAESSVPGVVGVE